MVEETVFAVPPRANSAALWTGLAFWLIRVALWLHGVRNATVVVEDPEPRPDASLAPPEAQHSWLSEWWHKLVSPKVPAEFSARSIICNRLSVVGPAAYCDIVNGVNGVRITMMTGTKETKGNFLNLWCKANGELEFAFVGSDGNVKLAVGMAPDFTIVNRIPPEHPPAPPPPPPTPEPKIEIKQQYP